MPHCALNHCEGSGVAPCAPVEVSNPTHHRHPLADLQQQRDQPRVLKSEIKNLPEKLLLLE